MKILPHNIAIFATILLLTFLPASAQTKRDETPRDYVVVLKSEPGAGLTGYAEADAVSMASAYGAEVRSVYSATIRGFSARMSERNAAALKADSRVKAVIEDTPIYPAGTQSSAAWGLDRLDQRHRSAAAGASWLERAAGPLGPYSACSYASYASRSRWLLLRAEINRRTCLPSTDRSVYTTVR